MNYVNRPPRSFAQGVATVSTDMLKTIVETAAMSMAVYAGMALATGAVALAGKGVLALTKTPRAETDVLEALFAFHRAAEASDLSAAAMKEEKELRAEDELRRRTTPAEDEAILHGRGPLMDSLAASGFTANAAAGDNPVETHVV